MKTGIDEKAKEGQGALLERTVFMTLAGVVFIAGLYFLLKRVGVMWWKKLTKKQN